MKRHAITITSALLGLVGLVAFGTLLFYVTDLAPIQALLLAFVALLGAFVALLVIVLVSNTRRPAGIDPNAPPNRARDPYAATTDELLRARVQLPDGLPYGGRHSDDTTVVRRLAAHFEADDASRPAPSATPAWALDLQNGHVDIGTELFPDPLPDDS